MSKRFKVFFRVWCIECGCYHSGYVYPILEELEVGDYIES